MGSEEAAYERGSGEKLVCWVHAVRCVKRQTAVHMQSSL